MCKVSHWQSLEASPNLPSREWAGRTLYVPMRLSATAPGDQKGRGEVIKEPSKPKTKCFGQGAVPQSPSAASAFICKRARHLLLHWGTNCTCYKQPESLPCSQGGHPSCSPPKGSLRCCCKEASNRSRLQTGAGFPLPGGAGFPGEDVAFPFSCTQGSRPRRASPPHTVSPCASAEGEEVLATGG